MENPSHAQHAIVGIFKDYSKLMVKHKDDDVGFDVSISVRVHWEGQNLGNLRAPPKASKIVVDRSFVQTSTELLVAFLDNSEMDAYEFAKWASVMEATKPNDEEFVDITEALAQEARYEYLWKGHLLSSKMFYLVSVKPQSLKKRPTRPQFRMEEGTIERIVGSSCYFKKLGSLQLESVCYLRVLPSGISVDRFYMEKNK